MAGPCLLVLPACFVLLAGGCGGSGSGEVAAGALPPYPAGLSAESSPWQVASTLIRALDEDDDETLLGLVAVQHGAEDVDAIYRKYGREHESDPAEVARLAVSGWKGTYGWFRVGATQVRDEQIAGDRATVEARGINPNTGRPRLLQIEMVVEGGLWKVKPGLQSREL